MTMLELLKDFLASLQAECKKRREKSQDGVCASCPHHGFCDKWKYAPATWPPAWIDEMSISLLVRYRPPKPPKKSPGLMVAEASALLKSAEARAAAKPRAALKDLRQKLDSLLVGVLSNGKN